MRAVVVVASRGHSGYGERIAEVHLCWLLSIYRVSVLLMDQITHHMLFWPCHNFEGSVLTRGYCYILYHKVNSVCLCLFRCSHRHIQLNITLSSLYIPFSHLDNSHLGSSPPTCETIITLSSALHKSTVSVTLTQHLIVWLCMEHIPYVHFTLPYVCFILPCVLVFIPCVTSNSSTCSLPFTTCYVSALSIYKSPFSNNLIAGFSNKSAQICVMDLWESVTLPQPPLLSVIHCKHLQFAHFHGTKSSSTLVWGWHDCPYWFSCVTASHSCQWNRIQINCLDRGCNKGQCTSNNVGLW